MWLDYCGGESCSRYLFISIYASFKCIQYVSCPYDHSECNESGSQRNRGIYHVLKKTGLSDIGNKTSDEANAFSNDTQKMLGTVFTFFEASSDGINTAKDMYQSKKDMASNYSAINPMDRIKQLDKDLGTAVNKAETILDSARQMEETCQEYFSDPQQIFSGMLAIAKDGVIDAVKITLATPISKSLTNKYLGAYPAGYLENLGVVDGTSGINYWGSSILLDGQSIEVCANYKIRLEFPFFDKIEFQCKATSSTRAWIGDGSYNKNGVTKDGKEKINGSKLEISPTETPGYVENNGYIGSSCH